MTVITVIRVSILPGEIDENAGRPQGSPLHVGLHKDVGETLAVSLFSLRAVSLFSLRAVSLFPCVRSPCFPRKDGDPGNFPSLLLVLFIVVC